MKKFLLFFAICLLFSGCSKKMRYSYELEVYYQIGVDILPYPYNWHVLQRIEVPKSDVDWKRDKVLYLIFHIEGSKLVFDRYTEQKPANATPHMRGIVIGYHEIEEPDQRTIYQMLVKYEFSPLTIWSPRLEDQIEYKENEIKMIKVWMVMTEDGVIGWPTIEKVITLPGKPIRHK